YYTPPITTNTYTLSLHDALPISYLMPARTADAIRSAGSVARCVSRRHRHSTKNTPSTEAALMRNTGPGPPATMITPAMAGPTARSEEHTSELQSLRHLVCRLLLE